MDYIKRVDAVNALVDDENENLNDRGAYVKLVYERLTTMQKEPVVRTSDVMGLICKELKSAAEKDEIMQLLIRMALGLMNLEDKEA